ncbi:MAG: N-acetylneuraminate synthase family protein [Flavobacterium sp.]|nr:N-acetylneuraminate synthase family protein [Flavobacterium sp.]
MKKTYIIAEIGNTHEGSVGLAKQFIKAAADCGVDAVKFQTHIFEAESLSSAPNPAYFKDESRKEYFERTAFNLEQYKILKDYAEQECDVDFFSSPFSSEAVDLLMDLGVSTFKIPSGEVSNIPLLELIDKTGKKVILSSGMSSWEELDRAVAVFKDKDKLTILQCTSEYPCKPENAGLNVMLEIKERYKCKVGFSDHTLGIGIPLTAVVFGATIVEKHFTLSKLMYGSDAKNSTEPEEFKHMVDNIRAAELAMNFKIDKDEKVKELGNMKFVFEKSIVSTKVLSAGHIISSEDIAYKKPGDGIPAKEFKNIIGRIVKSTIQANEKIEYSQLQ